MLDFEFDSEKEQLNKERHGVDFLWAEQLWEQTHVIVAAKNISGENRYLILAQLEGKCYVAIFTKRNTTIRFISCHRADRRLERIYEEHIRIQENV